MAYVQNQQLAPTTSSLVGETGATSDDSRSFFDPKRWFSIGKHEQTTVAYLDALYERAKTQRWRFDRQWYVNLSYFFGRQWIHWVNGQHPDIARLYEPQAPPWRVRLTVNRIRPLIRRELSKVMKEKPTAYVIPASTDDTDIAGAKAGEAIFEHMWRTLHVKDQLWVAQFWRAICGIGWMKDWWDPGVINGEEVGSVDLEVPTPFHIFLANLEQPMIDKQEHMIHVAMKSPEAVKTMYNVDVAPDTAERGGGVIESQYLHALGLEPGKVSQVTVKEIWIKPSHRYPAGAMFVWGGGKILYQASDPMTGTPKWPLPKMEFPFTPFSGNPTGRFYGDSTIVDLLAIQRGYNRTRSQIIEAINQMSKPQLVAPAGSIDPGKITSEPGLAIMYKPGFEKPTQLRLEPLPGHVPQELDRDLLDFADISGQHEVSQGTVPTGVTAATALSFIQEQDDTMIAPIIASMESGVERIGRHFLCHAHQWWDTARKVRVLGLNNVWEAYEFSKLDLYGNTDLNVQSGSSMPRSIAAKQAFIMELMKLQVISPDDGLRYLELAETTRLFEESQVDRRQAERENMRMSDQSIMMPAKFAAAFQSFTAQAGGGQPPGMSGGIPGGMSGGMPGLPPGMALPPGVGAQGGGLGGLPGMGELPGMEGTPNPFAPPGVAPSPSTSPAGSVIDLPFTDLPMSSAQSPDASLAPLAAPMGQPELGGINQPPSPVQAGLPMPQPLPIVPVNSWDNHEVHIEEHNRFRKGQKFESLPQQLKEEFERHVAMHRSALGLPPMINPEQMQQIMALQQLMPQQELPPGAAPEGQPPSNEPQGTGPL